MYNALTAALFGAAALTAQSAQHAADLLLRRKLPPRSAPDLLHNLLCRFLNRPGFLPHLRSFNGYDGPEILPSSTQPICLIGADAGHLSSAKGAPLETSAGTRLARLQSQIR